MIDFFRNDETSLPSRSMYVKCLYVFVLALLGGVCLFGTRSFSSLHWCVCLVLVRSSLQGFVCLVHVRSSLRGVSVCYLFALAFRGVSVGICSF